jgi:hypothetical protein
MKKLFVVLVAIALVASFASAQDIWGQGKMSAGPGVELALPMGTFGDVAGIGIGGFGVFQYGVTPEILLTGQIGYTSFAAKNSGWPTVSELQFLVGGKYNLSGQTTGGLYGMAQIGIVSYSVSEQTVTYGSYSVTVGGGSESDLAFAPGIGYQIGNIDASVKYLIVTTTGSSSSSLVLNVAYLFPL